MPEQRRSGHKFGLDAQLDFCHFEVAENTVFSGVSYVTAGFLHDIVSATEANKSANTRFFQHVHTYCESKNGKSRAQKRYFIAKTEEFLEHLRLHELVGREEYEGQIQQALRELERSPTSEESEKIMNEICLKVTIACYALRAYERVKKRKKPGSDDRKNARR